MFGCKVCIEKDKRISDLHEQISSLRAQLAVQITFVKDLTLPPVTNSNINREANEVLNGGKEEPDLTPEEIKENQRIKEERDALLSGSYM